MLYYILSLITLLGSIAWTPMKNDNTLEISQTVLHSSVFSDYGNSALVRHFINLDSDIFSGGGEVLLPKDITIIRAPKNLKLIKESDKLPKFNRYTALYSKGKLANQWKRLKRKTYSSLGIKELGDPKTDIKKIKSKAPMLIDKISGNDKENIQISSTPPKGEKIEATQQFKDNHKVFLSYIVYETENGDYKVLPVVLRLSPMKKIENYILKNTEEEEGGGE